MNDKPQKKKIIIIKKAKHPKEATGEELTPKEEKIAVKEIPQVEEKEKLEPTEVEKPKSKIPYKKGITYRKDFYKKEEEEKELVITKKKEEPEPSRILPKTITITETITVGNLAKKMNIKSSELIKKFMEMGELVTINQVIDSDTASLIASEYGIEVKVVSIYDEAKIELQEEDRPEDYVKRPPVVTIMGHVDHGKTSLLDAIRESNIAKNEAGGITQHIGAYKVQFNFKGKIEQITFLDTPGHEAFTSMRARGAKVTDIVVLVIAADDGVMPQTIESINHAKEANVPIIVAINKIDIPQTASNIERIKNDISKYNLIPEEWGGDTIIVPISAKEKRNIDKLLEAIILQAEILDLKANPKLKAKGVVLESKKDPVRGLTATILIQNGTLYLSDPFVAGLYSGKVRAMFDDRGNPLDKVLPSEPVLITGLDGLPTAGDPFQVVDSEKMAREISETRIRIAKEDLVKKQEKITLDNLYEHIKKGKVKELKIVLKTDVSGSAEALKANLEKIKTDEACVKVIHWGTSDINETDVMLASASNAIIIGFNVKYNKKVEELIKKEKVNVRIYKIIYDVIDDVKKALEGLLEPLVKEEGRGFAEIKKIFKISKVGIVLGCVVTQGEVMLNDLAKVIRNDEIIHTGKIVSLKRFKDDVKEVQEGMECGIMINPEFNDYKEGDLIEAYNIIKLPKTI